MPQEFDPYHRWLGIPPEELPADHYRLLGLVRFEDDIEVIRDAAERQIAHVRRYGLGKHSELSQHILNELAAAKGCLLVPETKAQYDAKLRESPAHRPAPSTSGPAEASGRVAPQVPPLQPDTPPAIPAVPRAGKRNASQPPPVPPVGGLGRHNGRRLWVIGGASVAGAALTGLLVWIAVLMGRGDDSAGTQVPIADGAKPGASPVQPASVDAEPVARPPKLTSIADQVARQGQALRFTAAIADRGTAQGPLLFSLAQAPAGARIDAVSGAFTWTPGDGEPRGKHAVTIQVAARDAADLSDRVSFVVDVQEAPLISPRLEPVTGQTMEAGNTQTVQVKASDRNVPPRRLVYDLGKAPPWARIDPSTGAITLQPPEAGRRGLHRIEVRVKSDAANAPLAETSFVVVLKPPSSKSGAPSGASSEPDLAGLSEIRGLSGPFDPLELDVSQVVARAAQELAGRVGSDPKVVPLFADEIGGPVAAVCEYNKVTKQLDGRVVEFFPGRDPISRFNARFLSSLETLASNPLPQRTAPNATVNTLRLSHARERAAQAAWADVGVQAYLEFKQGNRHGVAVTWDEMGRKAYWGKYQRGQRHDCCCLFKNGQPRIVVVYNQDEPGPVYLISAGRIAKQFAGHEEALQDETTKPLLAELDAIESQLKQGERTLEGQMRKTVQAMLGNLHQYQRFLEQQRRSMRDTRQKQIIQDRRKKATGIR